ncbi:hypothetical protein [Amycolatopsis sp. NPDC059021]|uniref:hypothetical protein n=1 Tax=Amycolatopsis sp. NPDC059021 TaxID=3346704 RepID=UPI00366A588D
MTVASTRDRCTDSAFGCGAAGCELTAGGELGTAEELGAAEEFGALGSGAELLDDGGAVDGAVETGAGSAPAGAANTPVNATAAANVAK